MPASWSRMVRANCTDGPACAWFSGGLEYRTWKPRPVAGPPSAWMETTALGCSALAIAARSSTHGPTWSSLPRDIAVRTPSWVSAWRISSMVSQLKVCSGKPSSVVVPLAWQSLVPPRPVGTWRVIEASLAPLWPGSRKTIMPAMLAGAAWVTGRGQRRRGEQQAGGGGGADTQGSGHSTGVTVAPRRLGLKVADRRIARRNQVETNTQGDRHATRESRPGGFA